MCLSPKYITNRTLHYDLFQPLKIQVPCGKCEECKKVVRNDWFIRCVYEWQRNQNGSTFFYTLTYNNEHLPRIGGFPCFSKRDIQKFLKRLRYRLSKLGYRLKYMITCEFGELYGRPHYHALFFVDKKVNPYWFLRFIQDSWKDETGSIGFVKTGDNVGQVSSYLGIQYVTKYVTKDFSHVDKVLPYLAPKVFMRYYTLFRYICDRYNYLPQCSFRMNGDFSFSRQVFGDCEDVDLVFVQKFITKCRNLINNIIPFHLQSTCMGANIVNVSTIDSEKIPFVDNRQNVSYYRLPRYIKRLCWYDMVENERDGKRNKFVLNDVGKRHVFDKLKDDIQLERSRIETTLLNVSNLGHEFISIVDKEKYGFRSMLDIVHWCQHFDLDLDVLAIYSKVFRGRVCPFPIEDEILTDDCIKGSFEDYAWSCLNVCVNYDLGEIFKQSRLVAGLTSWMWNNIPYFQPYEFALCFIDEMCKYVNENVSRAETSLERKVRKAQQFYKMFN